MAVYKSVCNGAQGTVRKNGERRKGRNPFLWVHPTAASSAALLLSAVHCGLPWVNWILSSQLTSLIGFTHPLCFPLVHSLFFICHRSSVVRDRSTRNAVRRSVPRLESCTRRKPRFSEPGEVLAALPGSSVWRLQGLRACGSLMDLLH